MHFRTINKVKRRILWTLCPSITLLVAFKDHSEYLPSLSACLSYRMHPTLFLVIPIPDALIKLRFPGLFMVHGFNLWLDYYISCQSSIPYTAYKPYLYLYHLMIPILIEPIEHKFAVHFMTFPWFLASVGVYAAELNKKKKGRPMSFMDWIRGIGIEGLCEEDRSKSKAEIRKEGAIRIAKNVSVYILAPRIVNRFLLEDALIIQGLPWFSLYGLFHNLLISLKFTCMVYIVDFTLSVLQTIFGIRFIRCNVCPVLATSPYDFWSHRWNRMLRNLFHKQVFHYVSDKVQSSDELVWERTRRGFKVFVVSAIMHEAINTICERRVSLEQFSFFIIQGIVVTLQIRLKQTMPGLSPPSWMSRIMTVWFMVATSRLFLATYLRDEWLQVYLTKNSPFEL